MLDSTGIHANVEVNCVFCPQGLCIPTYKPEYGHAGESLDEGPYLHNFWSPFCFEEEKARYQKLASGRLFRVQSFDSKIILVEHRLMPSSCAYSYGNPKCPDFGLGPDKVFWVCAHCWSLLNEDPVKVSEALVKKANWFKNAELWAEAFREQKRISALNAGE